MTGFFSLVLIIGAVGIWYFIKKKPDKKMRNIFIGITLVSFGAVGVLGGTGDAEKASSSTEKTSESTKKYDESSSKVIDLKLSLEKTELEADKDGKVVVNGTTTPGARVSVGMGIIGDSAEADEKGSFSLEYTLEGKENEELDINSTLDSQTASAKVTVKQNPEVLAKLEAETKASQEKEEAERKAQEEEDKKAAEAAKKEQEKADKIASASREQQNAYDKALDYLDFSAFSKEGLYEQLLYEKFPEDAARFAVDNIEVDWNSQAFAKAQDYLEYDSFSDAGLYDQLLYEKFTAEQAQYAIDNLNK